MNPSSHARSLALAASVVLAGRAGAQQPARATDLVTYRIAPSAADSTIRRFDEPNYVVFAPQVRDSAPLLVFLPGTGGRPQNTSDFANVAARQGYRVIGLAYDDEPAVAALCPREPDPGCSEKVRRKRIYGDDVTSLIDDRPEESVVNRLTSLLVMLARQHPADGWRQYLVNGQPNWPRIAVSGLSQGAYVLVDADGSAPDVILIATGSEVSMALEAHGQLTKDGIRSRVVSMPSWELFDAQPQSYRDAVLPPSVRARVSIEAASPFGWERYVGLEGAIIGVNHFGASAPGPTVMREFGFTPEHIVETAKVVLQQTASS